MHETPELHTSDSTRGWPTCHEVNARVQNHRQATRPRRKEGVVGGDLQGKEEGGGAVYALVRGDVAMDEEDVLLAARERDAA